MESKIKRNLQKKTEVSVFGDIIFGESLYIAKPPFRTSTFAPELQPTLHKSQNPHDASHDARPKSSKFLQVGVPLLIAN